MRILTNPGSNLTPGTERAYDLDLAPQVIVVDGFPHDARSGITHAKIDQWVQRAKEHPTVLGTSAEAFEDELGRLVQRDGQVLVVMTSRKLIGSHDAALQAAVKLRKAATGTVPRIEVFDSGFTDVMTGLTTLLAAEARKAGKTLDETLKLLTAFTRGGAALFAVDVLDYLVKGGRASFLQAWLGNALNIRPLIGVVDGTLERVGRFNRGADVVEKVVDALAAKVAPKQRVWAAIAHGSAPERAEQLLQRLCARYEVVYSYVRPLSPSIYLHLGPGALVGSVFPLAPLGWEPPSPTVVE